MFTGLVDDVGTVERVARTEAGVELRTRCRYDDLEPGESVAVSGVCLTVREAGRDWFTCAAVSTTVAITTIDEWKVGRRVNLERALRAGDRLGGHFVQGHVDGVAKVVQADKLGDSLTIHLALPPGLSDLMVDRGSVAVDGVSLTVIATTEPDGISLSIIDFTSSHTTLGALRAGDAVNVETDMIAKHVRRLLVTRETA